MAVSDVVSGVTSHAGETQIDLRRRPRPAERLIQGFLFLCGAISILTTIGIVYELSKESLSFFTRQLWEDANKRLVLEIDSAATGLDLSAGGRSIEEGEPRRVTSACNSKGRKSTHTLPYKGLFVVRSTTQSHPKDSTHRFSPRSYFPRTPLRRMSINVRTKYSMSVRKGAVR